MIIRELTLQECRTLLSSSRLGRLACTKDNVPYVVPIYFAFSGTHLYSFSMPGQKIDWMRTNPNVCLQVDVFTDGRQWTSVVVNGVFEELPDRIGSKQEREHAWSLLKPHANWWEPGGLKPIAQPVAGASPHLFYRIWISSMTGRQAVDG
ncbi:pyridoxamine 5'-phosphate oxidase family protein [Mesorhizobium sp. M1312]|uniref:pyridoxamine 5'-phosphate oxidase family protein n=1 Tax=unclassified Mesorhizobium TaxID=325217 RepID=UPI003337120F